MIINKITPCVDDSYLLKRLDTISLEPCNKNFKKVPNEQDNVAIQLWVPV